MNDQVRGVSLTLTQAYSVLMPTSIPDRLEYGDQVNRRLAGGCSRAEIAVSDGVSTQVVSKAAWLARAYSAEDRRQLGPAVLNTLTLSHLEVAAAVKPDMRATMLRLAADGGLSVRRLGQAIVLERGGSLASKTRAPSWPVQVAGKASDLRSACIAVRGYVNWNDRALRALLGGPSGGVVRDLASAGFALASRIEKVMPADALPPQS